MPGLAVDPLAVDERGVLAAWTQQAALVDQVDAFGGVGAAADSSRVFMQSARAAAEPVSVMTLVM